jgi:hypothetical protein
MDIRVISTGHEFHQVDSKIAQLLLELLPAAVERVNHQPPAPPADPNAINFSVRKNPYNDRWQVDMIQGSLVEGFQGTPDQLIDYGFGGKAQRKCPKEIVDLYRLKCEAQAADERARLRGR